MRRARVITTGVIVACGFACHEITEPPRPPSKGVTELTATPDIDTADGSSVVTLRVVVDTVLRVTNNQVSLTTTAGALLPGAAGQPLTLTANDSGVAYAQLRAPGDSATALITATVSAGSASAQSRVTRVTFVPAPPTSVQLLSTVFGVKAGAENSIELTAVLRRKVGTPSPGTVVSFSADTASGKTGDFGRFLPPSVVAGTTGSVTTKFSAGATSYRGSVVLRVVATRGTKTVSDSITLPLSAP